MLKGKEGKLPDYYHQLSDPRSGAEIWLAAAKSALGSGEPERCKGILEAFLEREPQNIAANLLLSHACLHLGSGEDLDESVAVARSALSQAKESEDAGSAAVQLAVSLGSRARLHTRQQVDRQKDRAEAIQLLSELASVAPAAAAPPPPAGARALYCLALLQAEAGQAAEALSIARRALAAAQGGGEAGLTALCLVLLAALLSSRGQHKLALSVLSAAPTAAPSSVPASPSGAGAAAAAAAPSAPDAAAAAAADGPAGPALLWGELLVWRLRSRLLAGQGDHAGALAALAQCKKALAGWAEGRAALPAGVSRGAVEAALVQVWCDLAVALAATGQRPEALAAADHALAAAPWSAVTRSALGAVHEALEEYDEAVAAYDMALALDPAHAPTLLRRAALHARRGGPPDLAVARDLLGEALRYDPASAAAWHALGRVAAAQEHRGEAEGHLLTAVQLAAAEPALPYSELPLEPGQLGV